MTSSLPNFPASPAAAALAGGTFANPAALAGHPALTASPEAGTAEFAALLGEGFPAAAGAPVVVAVGPGLPVAGELPAGPVGGVVLTIPKGDPIAPERIALLDTPADGTQSSRAPTPEEVEAAAAFVATLLQALQSAAPQSVTAGETSPAVGSGERVSVAPELPNGRPFPTELPVEARRADENFPSVRPAPEAVEARPTGHPADATEFALPAAFAGVAPAHGREAPVSLPNQAKPPFAPTEAAPLENAGLPIVAEPGAPTLPACEVAPDGAIACRLELTETPSTAPNEIKAAAGEKTSWEVQAELDLPGQAVVRVELELPPAPGQGRAAADLPEKFAALMDQKNHRAESENPTFERNFVFTGDKEVKSDSKVAGIGVAKTDSVISTVPTEETRQLRNPETASVLPVRADFQVAQPTAERITVEPAAPAGQNFAERAVATVTSLAEAQFSASMQKAGSVQLRLKFGAEDLSVRVELRGGMVHTDFRTDSPALREALATEWQAVAAAAPGQLQRFLDPVFSPASPGTNPNAGTQQQSAHRHSQQQTQDQAAARQDPWAGPSPFARRSALSANFVAEPSAPRVPAMLPTSVRLSVLA